MAFSISKYAETLERPAPAEKRDTETIIAEVLNAQRVGGEATLAIGRGLIELKERLPHGEWLTCLSERFNYSERTAQRLMKIAREWSNPTAVSDLGARKAFAILSLPPDERDTFIAGTHLVNGKEKTVIDMTSRELEKAIRERDEARKAAETAQADARSAEESRAKMEADMRALEEIHRSAQEDNAHAQEALAKAQAELKELRERPVDVAVEVDQKAVEAARAEAVAEMQAKVDAAEAARKEAEKRLKAAEGSLKDARKQVGDNAAAMARAEKAEAELAEARRQLEAAAKAEKAAAVNQNGDLALFNVIFNQTQEGVNKMHGLRLKLGRDDMELDEKLKTAINALADAVRRCAE